ncbi:WhiB family transcriptional regulator [Nocardia niigatensis]
MTEPLIPDWRHSAACKGHPNPEIWFTTRPDDADALEAKAICAGCPVLRDCGTEAVRKRERFGIVGGFHTEDELDWKQLVESVGVSDTRPRTRVYQWRTFTCECGREVRTKSPRNRCHPCSADLVEVGPVYAHVNRLRQIGGMTLREIAEASGLKKNTISHLARQEWISRKNSELLLAVTGEATADRS